MVEESAKYWQASYLYAEIPPRFASNFVIPFIKSYIIP